MSKVVPLSNGVMVDGKLYLRSDYRAARRISTREWLAFSAIMTTLGACALLMLLGSAWLIGQIVQRLRA